MTALGCATCAGNQPASLNGLGATTDWKTVLTQYGAVFVAGIIAGALLLHHFNHKRR